MLRLFVETQKYRNGVSFQNLFSTDIKKNLNWVFLGPPGVGKGTYSKIISSILNIPHISTGDLIREQIRLNTDIGIKVEPLIKTGKLVPDDIITELLRNRLAEGKIKNERGYILDGFPRTENQARNLLKITNLNLVLNMRLRDEALLQKCLGRRTCSQCNKDYNLANIYVKGDDIHPEITMAPISPPEKCMKYMTRRSDDTEETIKKRIKDFKLQYAPVEDIFRKEDLLVDFDVVGDRPMTLPMLKKVLSAYTDEFLEETEMAA